MNDTTASAPSTGQLVLVEDDPGSRGILTVLLESSGWSVAEASDGGAGFMLTQRLSPDVVVTDLRMPGMSGIQLAERISELTTQHPPPIVAITSDASGLRDAAVQSGLFTRVLTKPIAPRCLLEAVKQALVTQTAE